MEEGGMEGKREHWQSAYEEKDSSSVSWYAEHLADSFNLIRSVASPQDRIIDVGAGASTLVDDLIKDGYQNLTMLDISPAALDVARERLRDRASSVNWVAADVTTTQLPENAFDVWHDRAVFHFLTEEEDRRAYVEQVRRSLARGGHVIIATFSLEGPTRCSGLDVVRYEATSLARQFGEDFQLLRSFETMHVTPSGREQSFLFCDFQFISGPT